MPTPGEFAAVGGIAALVFFVVYFAILMPLGMWLTNRQAKRRERRERGEIRGGE